MSRTLSPGVVTDDLPVDTSTPVTTTKWRYNPCDPAAIHDRFPPLGTVPFSGP